MPSACNVATIVAWLCSIDPIARNSPVCSRAVLEAAKKTSDKPKELTGTIVCRGLVAVVVGMLGGVCNALTES